MMARGLERAIQPEEFSRDIYGIVSHPIMQEVYRFRHIIARAIREFLDGEGFVEFDPIMIGPVTDPGTRGAQEFRIPYYGREYRIMRSGILYKQLLATAMEEGKVYFFYPNLRHEPIDAGRTGRHLAEFVQVDLEVRGADHLEVMGIAERLLKHVIDEVRGYEDRLKRIWEFFGSERRELPDIRLPLKRMTHREAVELLMDHSRRDEVLRELERRFNVRRPRERLSFTAEIPWEWEWYLSKIQDQPFFIQDYPKGARGFYDREYPDRPGTLMDFDLLAPEGHGELSSGAAREYEASRVFARMMESGEDPGPYEWYLKFLRDHGKPTAGFGIGMERLVKYVCDLPSVHLARPAPKVPGVHTP
ncbi:MAG: asparagine ligase [Candidatus Korarchaeota archaeon NZ13-K]|nr:MAG: asparagine ligase [Candidatus Korarchaeota archaeon NZ13-K]